MTHVSNVTGVPQDVGGDRGGGARSRGGLLAARRRPVVRRCALRHARLGCRRRRRTGPQVAPGHGGRGGALGPAGRRARAARAGGHGHHQRVAGDAGGFHGADGGRLARCAGAWRPWRRRPSGSRPLGASWPRRCLPLAGRRSGRSASADRAACGWSAGERAAGIVSFMVEGYDPAEVAVILEQAAGVQVRSGFHCAACIHEHLGTRAGRHGAGCLRPVQHGPMSRPSSSGGRDAARTEQERGIHGGSSQRRLVFRAGCGFSAPSAAIAARGPKAMCGSTRPRSTRWPRGSA